MLGVDPRRFGPYASRGYLKAKNEEAYADGLHRPLPRRGARRRATAEARALLRSHEGARRGLRLGLRLGAARLVRPAGLRARRGRPRQARHRSSTTTTRRRRPGEPIREKWSFRRSNYFRFVGEECLATSATMSASRTCPPSPRRFVTGPGARGLARLDPRQPHPEEGRAASRLCHLLTQNGGVRSEFTVYRAGARRASISSRPARCERHDHDILRKLLPADGSVTPPSGHHGSGACSSSPARIRARSCRSSPTPTSPTEAFPWLTGKKICIGPAVAHALRVNFVGELGFELHHPIEMQNTIFDLLMEAGRGVRHPPVRHQAMLAMAVEKSYRLIGRELSIEYAAFESGLDRFVHPNKGAVPRPRRARRLARARLRGTASSPWRCTA